MSPTVTGKLRWILRIYAGGFLLGASAHARDIIQRGFLPNRDDPLAMNVYWTSLVRAGSAGRIVPSFFYIVSPLYWQWQSWHLTFPLAFTRPRRSTSKVC
jgi:hypothetical protein